MKEELRNRVMDDVINYINECFSEEYGQKIREHSPSLVNDMTNDILECSALCTEGYYSTTDLGYALSRSLFPELAE